MHGLNPVNQFYNFITINLNAFFEHYTGLKQAYITIAIKIYHTGLTGLF